MPHLTGLMWLTDCSHGASQTAESFPPEHGHDHQHGPSGASGALFGASSVETNIMNPVKQQIVQAAASTSKAGRSMGILKMSLAASH